MKKPYSKVLSTLTAAILVSMALSLSAGLAWAQEESCTVLLETRCEKCHYVTRVCQKIKKEMSGKSWFGSSSSSWKRSIKNMVRQGAKLTKDEQKKLAGCLSEPSPEILDFCNLKK